MGLPGVWGENQEIVTRLLVGVGSKQKKTKGFVGKRIKKKKEKNCERCG